MIIKEIELNKKRNNISLDEVVFFEDETNRLYFTKMTNAGVNRCYCTVEYHVPFGCEAFIVSMDNYYTTPTVIEKIWLYKQWCKLTSNDISENIIDGIKKYS